ncbi:MAG TPA: cytochrome c [Planctomycetota bacterium]|nr:cytochrome c [Planctomycetota bacterium]
MKTRSISAVVVILGGFAVLGLLAREEAGAQVAKGKTRPAPTKYLMRGITQPNCKGIADLLKDPGPADDKAWETAACHAACLNELSAALMQDGRCPDATWAGASKSLTEGSAAVLAAAEKKDLAAAKTAFGTVTASCKTCHDAHKPKK